MLNILQYLKHINLFFEALPFIFALIFLKRILTESKRFFFIYTFLTTFFILLVALFIYIINNKTAYFLTARFHITIEFSILSYIFSISIKNSIIKKAAIFSIFPFIILCIYDYFASKTPSIAYTPLLVECLFFILLIIYFFFEKLKQDVVEPLFSSFIFWFSVAFLLNFSGNFLLFVYSETSTNDPDFKTNYTIIYSTVTIIKNLLLCFAISMKENPTKISNNNTFLNNIDPSIFNPVKTKSH